MLWRFGWAVSAAEVRILILELGEHPQSNTILSRKAKTAPKDCLSLQKEFSEDPGMKMHVSGCFKGSCESSRFRNFSVEVDRIGGE